LETVQVLENRQINLFGREGQDLPHGANYLLRSRRAFRAQESPCKFDNDFLNPFGWLTGFQALEIYKL